MISVARTMLKPPPEHRETFRDEFQIWRPVSALGIRVDIFPGVEMDKNPEALSGEECRQLFQHRSGMTGQHQQGDARRGWLCRLSRGHGNDKA
jgi:hypothetical protein